MLQKNKRQRHHQREFENYSTEINFDYWYSGSRTHSKPKQNRAFKSRIHNYIFLFKNKFNKNGRMAPVFVWKCHNTMSQSFNQKCISYDSFNIKNLLDFSRGTKMNASVFKFSAHLKRRREENLNKIKIIGIIWKNSSSNDENGLIVLQIVFYYFIITTIV